MPRLIADGQLAATSATLLGTDRFARQASVFLFNTSKVDQEVQLTLTRFLDARTIFRGDLEPDGCRWITGVGMDPASVLAGFAETASAVNYLVFQTESRDDQSLAARPLSDKFQVEARTGAGAEAEAVAVPVKISRRSFKQLTVKIG